MYWFHCDQKMNNWLFINSLKLIFFTKFHTATLLKPLCCWDLPCRMCSLIASEVGSSEDNLTTNVLAPPRAVKGMKKLDKNAFDVKARLPAVSVGTGSHIKDVLNSLKNYRLQLMNFRPVFDVEPDGKQLANKVIFLDPSLIVDFNSFKGSIKTKLKEWNITEKNFRYVERTITYENWRIEEIIKAVLPEDLNFSGYSIIGHIAHFNLRDELLDYKQVLGEIILSKVKIVKTVVNKIHEIDNTYRNFQMELICGENNMITKLRENACVFEMDFSKVYWNPRLGTEHERVIGMLNKNDVLYDVFAGIGPFAVPSAKKGCLVVANDLNPDAFEWLKHNVNLNKVTSHVQCFNCDAKDFISMHFKKHLLSIKDIKGNGEFKVHVTMNLPAAAVDFVNEFSGLFSKDEFGSVPKDIICHLYCFVKTKYSDKLDDKQLADVAREFVEAHLCRKMNDNVIEICLVRKVAPSKVMFRVSFLFEPDFLIRKSNKRNNEDEDICSNKKL